MKMEKFENGMFSMIVPEEQLKCIYSQCKKDEVYLTNPEFCDPASEFSLTISNFIKDVEMFYPEWKKEWED